jgi:regulator of protease activity HflC (stomatin/prohibitin superfamily)
VHRRFGFEGPKIEEYGIIAIIIIVLFGGLLFFGFGRINVGYVSVVVDPVFGTTKVVGNGMNAQYFMKAPWASVYKIYVATDSVYMSNDATTPDALPAVESLTKDGLTVNVDVTVRWSINPDSTAQLYQRYPKLDWKDRAIIPIIRETIRNLLSNYTAIETIENRTALGFSLTANLGKSLKDDPSLSGAIILDAVNIRNINLPDNFVQAIEKKLASEQLSIAAEFNKTRLLVIADANAQTIIIEAKGEAQAKLVIANATKQAIMRIAEANPEIDVDKLTSLYMYLQTLQNIADKGNTQFIVVPDDSQYILPIP